MTLEPPDEKKDRTTEHLSNERTFLAWVRTGVATISLGFVIARFSFWLNEIALSVAVTARVPHSGLSLPIGLGLVAFGALMVVLAAWRYRAVARAIERGQPLPKPALILFTTLAVVLLAIILIAYLLTASNKL